MDVTKIFIYSNQGILVDGSGSGGFFFSSCGVDSDSVILNFHNLAKNMPSRSYI